MKNIRTLGILLFLSFLTSFLALDPILHQGIFTAHDIEANIGRFAAFHLSVTEGHLLPSWAGYVANGYGSPILMFTYTLPYYLQLPLKLIGLTLTDTTKLYVLLTFVGSACLMYIFLRRQFSPWAAFIGSLFYVYAPYRINDIYARGSISEHTAFLILPLVGIAILNLLHQVSFKNIVFLSLTLLFLLMSHPFFIIIVAPFFIAFLLWKLWKSPNLKRIFIGLGISGMLFLFLSCFFTLPLFMENKYLHYDINPFSTVWSGQLVPLLKLVLPVWTFIDVTGKMEYQTWQVGIMHLLLVLVALITFWTAKKSRPVLFFGFILFGISIILMTSVAYPLYANIKILREVQFPWRFMGLTILSLSFLGAATADAILPKLRINLRVIILILIIAGLFGFYLPFAKGHGYQNKTDFYYNYELLTNTEGVATTPYWADVPEKYPRAALVPTTTSTSARVNLLYRSGTRHVYTIDTPETTVVIDDTFYFPGWQVSSDGKSLPIEFQNPDHRGLITYQEPAGRHQIEVVFVDTKLRRGAKLISLFTALGILGVAVFRSRRFASVFQFAHIKA